MIRVFICAFCALCGSIPAAGQTRPSTQPALYDSIQPHILGGNAIKVYTVSGIPFDSYKPADVSRAWIEQVAAAAKADGAAVLCLDCEQLCFHAEPPPDGILTFSYTDPHDRQVLSSLRLSADGARQACRAKGLRWGIYGPGPGNTGRMNSENPAAMAEAKRQRDLFGLLWPAVGADYMTVCGYASPQNLLPGGFERWKKELLCTIDLQRGIAQETIVYVWPLLCWTDEVPPPPLPLDWWAKAVTAIHDSGCSICVWGNGDPRHPEYGVIAADSEHLRVVRQIYGK